MMYFYGTCLVRNVKLKLRYLVEQYEEHALYEDVLKLIPYPPLSANYDPMTSVFEDTIRAYDTDGFFKLVWGFAKGDYDPELHRWLVEPGEGRVWFDLYLPPGMFACVFVCWMFCMLITHPFCFQRSDTTSISSIEE